MNNLKLGGFNSSQSLEQAKKVFESIRWLVGDEAVKDMTISDAQELLSTLPKDFQSLQSSNGLIIPTHAPESPSKAVRDWPDISGWLS